MRPEPSPLRLFLLPLLVCSAGSLAGQGFVAPDHFTFAEGNGASSDGPGDTAPLARYLQIHEGITNPSKISSLALRRDGYATGDFPRTVIACDIFVSSGGKTYAQPDSNFDANHGSNKTQVVKAGLYSFPLTQPGRLVRPFEYVFKFQQPFQMPGRTPLCWEMQISTRSNTQKLDLDGCFSWKDNPDPAIWHKGTGCTMSSASAPLTLVGSATPDWKNSALTLTFSGTALPPQSFLNLGSNDERFGSIPLPFAIPGSKCFFYTDSVMVLPLAVSSGAAKLSVKAKAGVYLHGGSVFSQILGIDKAANAWGVVTSNMAQHHLIAPFSTVPIAKVYLHGSLGAAGTPLAFQGLVTRFE